MLRRRLTATAMGLGMLAVTACSSSDGGGAATTTSASVAAATTSTTFVPVTTAAPLSAADQEAAKALVDGSGFREDQSACMVSVVVSKVGETDGLKLFGDAPGELSTAQQEALVTAFDSCLSEDDLGGLVGVTFQALATNVGGALSREQITCVGRAMIDAHSLRAILFDEALLPKIFADKVAVTSLLSSCLPAEMAESLASAAVQVAAESTSTTAP